MRALAQFVMRGPLQAGGVAAVASAIPLLFWIGAAVIGLVILRLGIGQGLQIGLWALLPALGWSWFGQDPTALAVLLEVIIQMLPVRIVKFHLIMSLVSMLFSKVKVIARTVINSLLILQVAVRKK